MNRILSIISAIVLLLISCGEKEKIVEVPIYSNCAPSAPQGVNATNVGDYISVCWYPNPETDIVRYDVYRAMSFSGNYTYIGSVNDRSPKPAEYCFNDTEVDYGVQYYYAIVAVDEGGLESAPSYEDITEGCAPSAPRGVYATNLPDAVWICWYPNAEKDVKGYDVYRALSFYGDYFYIGTVNRIAPEPAEYCFDDTQTDYGVQHYYAVVAFDQVGLESDLSYEEVSGTRRPEGVLELGERDVNPNASGYDLSSLTNMPQSYALPSTDIYYDVLAGTSYIVAPGDSIQDYGYTGSFDVINYAPVKGWSPRGVVEAIVGHCYILRLAEPDGAHYAKLYVTAVANQSLTFWWAYQTAAGNRDLAPPAPGRGAGRTTSPYQREVKPGLKMRNRSMNVSATPPIVERVTWTRNSRLEQQSTY